MGLGVMQRNWVAIFKVKVRVLYNKIGPFLLYVLH